MREGIKTSLVSILCVVATSAAFAAPTVRTIGGTGTYESAAAATAASRAGSLRATGGYIRPTTSVSNTALNSATATTPTATTTGGAVSTGGATVGRVASSPRLSIGKYVGAPKSISTSGGGAGSDLTGRVEKLETDVAALETDKQDALQDSTYITIAGDELVLDLEKIKQDLEIGDGNDGREVEMGTNDNGLLWRYVGDTDWQTLITWAEISQKLDFDGIDDRITEIVNNMKTELKQEIISEISDDFVAKDQGTGASGKTLVVGEDGIVAPATVDFVTTDDLDNLGDLAYEDTVSTRFIDDKAVERAKLADEITNTLDQVTAWENWWNANKPGEGDYVMSVTADGTRQWFRVITADEAVSGGDTGGAGGDSGETGGDTGGTDEP